MPHKLTLCALFAISLGSYSSHAVSASTQEQEYQQVRKIALRDARVRAAYEEADQRLTAKILQIDPALKSYVESGGAGHAPAEATQPAPPHERHAKSPAPRSSGSETASSAAKKTHSVKTAASQASGATHVVAKGETLSSIAKKYGVTVAALKSANHIQDERKLPAGQTITIPKGGNKKGEGEGVF